MEGRQTLSGDDGGAILTQITSFAPMIAVSLPSMAHDRW
jgi:hypothetical protein